MHQGSVYWTWENPWISKVQLWWRGVGEVPGTDIQSSVVCQKICKLFKLCVGLLDLVKSGISWPPLITDQSIEHEKKLDRNHRSSSWSSTTSTACEEDQGGSAWKTFKVQSCCLLSSLWNDQTTRVLPEGHAFIFCRYNLWVLIVIQSKMYASFFTCTGVYQYQDSGFWYNFWGPWIACFSVLVL